MKIVPRVDASDYLSTPALAAYFDALEYEAYYLALKRAGPRRDFHGKLMPVLERFVAVTNAESAAAAVNRAITAAQATGGRAGAADPLAYGLAQHPRGCELLGVAEPLTYDSLKAAYRLAARRNHPDVGGEHDAMVAVNEAFSSLHSLLRNKQLDGREDDEVSLSFGGIQVVDCADYRYVCGKLLFLVTLDDWNLDTALGWLERIITPQWQRARYAQATRSGLTEPSSTLASRLWTARREAEARRAFDIAKETFQSWRQGSHSGAMYLAEKTLNGARNPQVVISHPRQAKHALRLGAIDAKRYQRVLLKHASEAKPEANAAEKLRRFLLTSGFIKNLPTDHIASRKIESSGLVPEPGYYVTRISQLTDAQQAEYLRAFDGTAPLSLVRKYAFVRFVSLLESVLFHPGNVDYDAAANEVALLGGLYESNESGSVYAAIVAEISRSST